MRFFTRKVHAFLDYPVALNLMVLPFVFGLGTSNPLAKWLSVATGIAAFILTVLTDQCPLANYAAAQRAHSAAAHNL